jgi:hypothetical protein
MELMSLLGKFAAKVGLRERRRNGRMPTRGLEAFYSAGGKRKQAEIRDISPTGICLAAGDELPPGSEVLLTLRRKRVDDEVSGAEVSIPTRVARAGKQELGLEFVHEHLKAAEWTNLVLKAAEHSQRNDGVHVFKIARALAFLQRVSPSIEDRFLKAVCGGMSYDGAEWALQIVLTAQEMLWAQGHTPKSGVDSKLIEKIIVRGANTDLCEAEMVHYWAGLLASSSLEGSDDQESLKFADLLSKLELTHARLLGAGCERAMALGWGAGYVLRQRVFCSAGEIRKITRARDMMTVERGVNRLEELGLLQKSQKLPIFEPVTEIDVTPTGTGLNLCARCDGRPGVPEVYNLDSVSAGPPRLSIVAAS